MGKSLSILAITSQVYDINGWSIWPPHLALGDDDELPISMEHLRPYLRKRKGPFIAPPGLRHNQRYYPKLPQSRGLLMKSDANSDSHDSVSEQATEIIRNIQQDSTKNWKQETKDFIDSLLNVYRNKHSQNAINANDNTQLLQNATDQYESLKWKDDMIRFTKDLSTELSKHDSDASAFSHAYVQEIVNTLSAIGVWLSDSNKVIKFIGLFQKYLQKSDEATMQQMKELYQSLKYQRKMTCFINDNVIKPDPAIHDTLKAITSSTTDSADRRILLMWTLGMPFIQNDKISTLAELKNIYQSHKFDPEMIGFMERIYKDVDHNILESIISVEHTNNPNKSDKDKLMITMESLSKDIIKNHQGKRWIFAMLYQELKFPDAEQFDLIPKPEQILNGTIINQNFPQSGIIIFSRSDNYYREMNSKINRCEGLKYFREESAQIMNSPKYPYLNTVKGRFVQIWFLDEFIQKCVPEEEFQDVEKNLVVTTVQVMADLIAYLDRPELKWQISFWNSELWKYAIKWRLVPDDAELQNWIQTIDMPEDITLERCTMYIDHMRLKEHNDKYPFVQGKIEFVVTMRYLEQVFDRLKSDPSELYKRLNYVKDQYKEWQFDSEVIDTINNMFYNENPKVRHALNVIISNNGRDGYNIDDMTDDDKLMIILESLTRDVVNAKNYIDIWKYRYLYSLVYKEAVAESLIPDDTQRWNMNGVSSSQYQLAKKYDIFIFTGENIGYGERSNTEKDAVMNGMMVQKQNYPILIIDPSFK